GGSRLAVGCGCRFRCARRSRVGRSARRAHCACRGVTPAHAGAGVMNARHGILAAMIGALLATSAAAQSSSSEPDLAYAEYQRGRYVGAFKEAMRRVEEKNDPKSMTLLGELYADGLGVPNDDKKAAEWYKLAAARGDREAMFALSMFKMTGRGGPADRLEAVRLLTEAAKLGHVVGAY